MFVLDMYLVKISTVDLEPADVDVLGGLLLLAHLVRRVGGREDVQQVGALLRSQEVEGCRVAIGEHHQVSSQGDLLGKECLESLVSCYLHIAHRLCCMLVYKELRDYSSS